MHYNPDNYWSDVAQKIQSRGESYVAGDDNPYNRYKRRKFLGAFLDAIDFDSKVVLEVGFGPGGNLQRIATHFTPKKLLGVDVSQKMFELATNNLRSFENIELNKIDGANIPYSDQSVDLTFTVTVLQHISDEQMFRSLVREICRVTRGTVILMEDIGSGGNIGGKGSYVGRRVAVYEAAMAEHGFELNQVQFLKTRASRALYQRLSNLHRRFSRRQREEGESAPVTVSLLTAAGMLLTRSLDRIVQDAFDLAEMVFRRPTG